MSTQNIVAAFVKQCGHEDLSLRPDLAINDSTTALVYANPLLARNYRMAFLDSSIRSKFGHAGSGDRLNYHRRADRTPQPQ